MIIRPAQTVTGAAARPAQRKGAAGFQVPEEAHGAAGAAPVAMMSLESMLSLQEVDPPAERDRRAKRQGQALLDALARLQASLLGGSEGTHGLEDLANLARDVPVAADPGLRGAVAAIVLRAHVEIARRQVANGLIPTSAAE